jgi:hypothetical protein
MDSFCLTGSSIFSERKDSRMKKQYIRYRVNERWTVKDIDEVTPALLSKQQKKSFLELSKHLKAVVKLWSYEVTSNCNFNQESLHQELVQCYQLLGGPDLSPLISNPETREHFLVSVNKEIEKIERGDYESVGTLNDYQNSVEDISIELIACFDDKKKTRKFELCDINALKGLLAFKSSLN